MKLGVGIIGLGVGAQHLESYLKISSVEVIKICDSDPVVLNRFKNKYPNIEVTENAHDLLKDSRINLVSICSKDNDHYDQIITAIENEKHVFSEKPLCLRFEEAQTIKALLKRKPHLKLCSNLILRRYPRFQKLKELVQQQILGDLFLLEGDYNYGRLEKILTGWRGRIPGYSPVLGGGIHIIDLIFWLTGLKPVEVVGMGAKLVTAKSNYQYFDLVTALFKYESGLIAKVNVNLGCIYPHFHKFSAYGTKATFENDFEYAKLFTQGDPSREFSKLETEYPGAFKGDLIAQFVTSIVDNGIPPVTQDEIFTVLSICYAFDKVTKMNSTSAIEYL